MRRHILALVVALSATACGGASSDTTADLKAIDELRAAYSVAFTSEDAARTAALFEPDGILMDDNQQQIIGRDKIRAHLEQQMTGMETDIQLKSEETVVNGDWAFDRGQTWVHIMSKDPKSTMPMIMDQGKYLVILKRQANGGWQIARAMTNSNIGK
jgi:uncharacterized protein (TIGR02246 family)